MKCKRCDGSGDDGDGRCYICAGTGEVVTCPMCRGDGWYMSQDPGDLAYRQTCMVCHGDRVIPANQLEED